MKHLILAIIVALTLITPAFGMEDRPHPHQVTTDITPISIVNDLKNATTLKIEVYNDNHKGQIVTWTSIVEDVMSNPGSQNEYVIRLKIGTGYDMPWDNVYIPMIKKYAVMFNKGDSVTYTGTLANIDKIIGIRIGVNNITDLTFNRP